MATDDMLDLTQVATESTKVRVVEGYYLGEGPQGEPGPLGQPGFVGDTGAAGAQSARGYDSAWLSSFKFSPQSLTAAETSFLGFSSSFDGLGVQYDPARLYLPAGTYFINGFFNFVATADYNIRLQIVASSVDTVTVSTGAPSTVPVCVEFGMVFSFDVASFVRFGALPSQSGDAAVNDYDSQLTVFRISAYPDGGTGDTGNQGPGGPSGTQGIQGAQGGPRTFDTFAHIYS